MLAETMGWPSRPVKIASGGMGPMPASTSSWPVMTARTPGIPAAAEVSTETMSAWPKVERTKTPCACPGSSKSSVNRPAPVTRGTSSRRDADWALPKRRPAAADADGGVSGFPFLLPRRHMSPPVTDLFCTRRPFARVGRCADQAMRSFAPASVYSLIGAC